MKVSVVIPAYNEEEYIGNCLESLMKQEEKADEIIVVNNNSHDKTVEVAKQYPVRIVNETTQGMIPARNRGFNEARFETIARCDADATLPPDWLKRAKQLFVQHNVDAISGPAHFTHVPVPTLFNFFTKAAYIYTTFLILGYKPLYGPNMILKKEIWQKVKDEVCLDDKKVHEDLDLSMHIHRHGGKIAFIESFVINVSPRRFKSNLGSLLIDYPVREFKTIGINRQLWKKQ